MSLWDMSICGGIFIAVIMGMRGLFRRQFPSRVFQVLWLAAVLRLLIPVAVPWQYSVYSLAKHCSVEFSNQRISGEAIENEILGEAALEEPAVEHASFSAAGRIWIIVYLLGAILCALYHAVFYLKWRKELKTSLPVENLQIRAWADALPLRRKVSVRQWEGTVTPLVYGVLHPVILLPKPLAEEAPWQLKFVLVHEYMHIRHFDAVKKAFLLLAHCVHWFNPLVWEMGVLANRDLELCCDEQVIRYLGEDKRADYAYALIDLEEQRSDFLSWANSFSKNAMKERVVAIMKGNKKSVAVGILSGVMTAGIIMIFVTSAFAMGKTEEEESALAQSNDTYYAQAKGDGIVYKKGDVAEQDSEAIAYADENVAEQGSEAIAYTDDVARQCIASEGISEQIDMEIPKEYAAFGLTANPHTACLEFLGKKVAVLYDKDRWLQMNDVPQREAVYLEVCRDREGKIEKIKECSKKQMQEILKKTGLVF